MSYIILYFLKQKIKILFSVINSKKLDFYSLSIIFINIFSFFLLSCTISHILFHTKPLTLLFSTTEWSDFRFTDVFDIWIIRYFILIFTTFKWSDLRYWSFRHFNDQIFVIDVFDIRIPIFDNDIFDILIIVFWFWCFRHLNDQIFEINVFQNQMIHFLICIDIFDIRMIKFSIHWCFDTQMIKYLILIFSTCKGSDIRNWCFRHSNDQINV